jgi:hypothetical protein
MTFFENFANFAPKSKVKISKSGPNIVKGHNNCGNTQKDLT